MKELVVLSEKQRILDAITEDLTQELADSDPVCPSFSCRYKKHSDVLICLQSTSVPSFQPIHSLGAPSVVPSCSSCNVALFRHAITSRLYAIKTFHKSSISYDTPILEHAMKEQMILRLLTQMNLPYVLKLRWSFQDAESMRIVTVKNF